MTDESASGHFPVMLEQVRQWLAPAPGRRILDLTVGRGGHCRELIDHLLPGGGYIGLDVDAANLDFVRRTVPGDGLTLVRSNFADAGQVLDELQLDGVDGVLADLGFASNQMDDPSRGLSFRSDGPLDMRLDDRLTTTAADLLARLSEQRLADLIYQYGEERRSRKIARKIVDQRRRQPMKTTKDLAELCAAAYGPAGRRQKIHPATRTFMALRIAVNDELGRLETLLDQMPQLVNPSARVVIISFHSLEDRMVKHTMRRWRQEAMGEILTRKPLMAEAGETAVNPRSRSAKMRVFEFKKNLQPPC